MSPLKGKA